jgi:hypothetical protein
MFWPHSIYVFCIYLRKNSNLCHLYLKMIGFYNQSVYCAVGTGYLNKSSLCYNFNGLIWCRKVHCEESHNSCSSKDITLGWSNEGGWDRWYMWYKWMRRQMHTKLWFDNVKERHNLEEQWKWKDNIKMDLKETFT